MSNNTTSHKKSNLPDFGTWPDKLCIPALIGGIICVSVGLLLAFFYASPVNGAAVNGAEYIGGVMVTTKLLLSQKIFYFHMPAAITSMVLLVFVAYYSVRYLMTKHERFDTAAKCAMEVSLVFVVATMCTGEAWTRFEWGVWWTWEPRLTTYLILTLVVIAYFILRNAIDDPNRRATYSAIIGILCFVDVPITFAVTRLIPSSLHPVVFREGGMTADMALAVCVCMIGLLCVGFAMYRLRFRQARLDERARALIDATSD